jgi:hypothetical protein
MRNDLDRILLGFNLHRRRRDDPDRYLSRLSCIAADSGAGFMMRRPTPEETKGCPARAP